MDTVQASAPVRVRYRRALLLQFSATALAIGAQALVEDAPWATLVGFAFAMALFAGAERMVPRLPEEVAHARRPGRLGIFLAWLGVGMALGLGAGVAVHLEATPRLSHALWGLGLLVLAGVALGARKSGSMPRPAIRVLIGTALLLVLCGGIFGGGFGWPLAEMPPEVHGDDAEIGNGALSILEEEPFDIFRSGWFDLPMFHAVPTAIGLKLFGPDLLGLRATSAALATVTVLALFLLVRRLWGPGAGAVAAFLLVTQRYFIHLGRSGHLYVDTPALAVVALWLFVEAWCRLSRSAAVACGIALGLGIQSYYASRIVPLLLLGTFVLWLFGSERELRWRRTGLFAVVVLVSAAVSAPMFGFFANHWEGMMSRLGGTSVFSEESLEHLTSAYETDSFAQILWSQSRAALTLFNATGDTSVQYGYENQPMLEPVSAALFVLGLAMIVARPGDRRNQMVFLWILLPVILGGALTIDTPFYPRISGVVPFACIAVALPIQRILSTVRAAVPSPSGRTRAGALAAALLLLVAVDNLWSYFVDYAPGHRHSPAVELSAWIREHGKDRITYRIGPPDSFPTDHGAVRFLTQGFHSQDVWDLDEFLEAHDFEREQSAFVVMPEDPVLLERLEAAVGPLALEARWRKDLLLFYAGVPLDANDGEPCAVFEVEPPGLTRLTRVVIGLYDGRLALYGLLAALALLAFRGARDQELTARRC